MAFPQPQQFGMTQAADPMGGMAGMLPLLLLSGDNKSSDSLLPLMLMGGMGGAGGAGMMGNPIMMLGGGMGGDPNNPMSSMLPLLLLGDDAVTQISDADALKLCDPVKADATKLKVCTTAVTAYTTASALCTKETDATKKADCVKNLADEIAAIKTAAGTSSSSDLMMLMMMGGMGGAGGAGGMGSMLPLLLMDGGLGGSNKDMLLPLMMMQQPQIDPITGQAAAGGMGGMDPLMMMLMLK